MREAWIALAMLLLASAVANSQTAAQQIPPVADQAIGADKSQHAPESKSGSAQPAPANASGTDNDKPSADNTNQKTNQESHLLTDPITLFTGLLVVVGALQVVVYWKQKGVMERALSATEKAANAAELSATSAMGVARGHLLLSHMDFGDMGVADFNAKLQSPKMNVRVVNYGQTFAVPKVQALEIVCTDVLPSEPAYNNIYRLPFAGMALDKTEGYELVQPTRPVFSPDEIRAIRDGRKFLWVYGFICYEDFLGKAHMRRFCQRLYLTQSADGYIKFAEAPNTPRDYTESD